MFQGRSCNITTSIANCEVVEKVVYPFFKSWSCQRQHTQQFHGRRKRLSKDDVGRLHGICNARFSLIRERSGSTTAARTSGNSISVSSFGI